MKASARQWCLAAAELLNVMSNHIVGCIPESIRQDQVTIACCCPGDRPFDAAKQTNATGGWVWVDLPQSTLLNNFGMCLGLRNGALRQHQAHRVQPNAAVGAARALPGAAVGLAHQQGCALVWRK